MTVSMTAWLIAGAIGGVAGIAMMVIVAHVLDRMGL